VFAAGCEQFNIFEYLIYIFSYTHCLIDFT